MSHKELTPKNETAVANAIARRILNEKLNKDALLDLDPFRTGRKVATRFQDEGWVRQDPSDGTWSVADSSAFASQVRSALADLEPSS